MPARLENRGERYNKFLFLNRDGVWLASSITDKGAGEIRVKVLKAAFWKLS